MQERNEALSEYARGFAEYLAAQTGVQLTVPVSGDLDSLRMSFERLDLALGQIADLATIYGNDTRSDIEHLTAPTAVLIGEYLRAGLGARWLEPAFDGDDSLMLITADGIALDLGGVARTTLMSPQPSLAALVERLMETQP